MAPTRLSDDDRALQNESDAATVLGMTRAEPERMIDVGTAMEPWADLQWRRRSHWRSG